MNATESQQNTALRLEVDDQGRCAGLRVRDTVVPWVPDLPKIVGDTTTTKDQWREVVQRFLPEAYGLRWTQTIKNIATNAIGVGPQFSATGGEGKPWLARGLPLEIRMFPKNDIGVSLIQHPDEVIWSGNRRLDPGQSITFTALIRVHEADWRPGMAALVAAYPEFMNPPNPRVHQVAGGGAYSNSEKVPDVEKALTMGYRVNWKASFDFPAIGMFVAPSPVDVNTTWKNIRGQDTSIARLEKYAAAMKNAGFHVLNYFNITEAGYHVQETAPPRTTAKDEDLWRHPNDWVHYGIRDAVLESQPGKVLYTNWERCIIVDPAEIKYRAHLLDQATRLARDIPDADGVCIDRMDHLGRLNVRRYDGLGLYDGKATGARILVSWMQVMDEIGPLFHKADKVILGNPIGQYNLAALRHLDGIYTEYWNEMEACSSLCMNKPLIVWSGPYDDAAMQKLLHHGAWPTCPMDGNDHCAGPNAVKENLLADYGRMFDALRGRRWALHARPIACEDVPSANLNLFAIPGGYLATVTSAGNATKAKLRLPSLPLPVGVNALKAWSITPGADWKPLTLEHQGQDWLVTVPLGRGCGLVRLHWSWIEPFQPWWKIRPSIDVQTTVAGAEIRATTDGAVLTEKSPLWKSPMAPDGSLTLRAGVWKDKKQVGEELVTTFIEAP